MIGSTIGHYKIVEHLGAGGMGEVYKAEDTTLGRSVALKFLAAHLLNDEEAKTRFLREAKAAAAISHPNICTVFEVAVESGKTFLVMDHLEGESLEALIEKGPLPLTEALDIGRQVAEGLEAAHEKGIVHRDIKPANIMVDAKGRTTILDFGLARLTEASKLTRADQTVGTAAYMSPEQILGSDVDHRTDIWALGCVLYEMVSGARPFQGEYDQALAYEIVQEEAKPLTGLRTGVPIELELLVGKCLEKEPGRRYQHTVELQVDLENLGRRLDSGRPVTLPVPSHSTSLTHRNGEISQRSRERIPWALAGSFALALAVVAGLQPTPDQAAPKIRRFAFVIPDVGRPVISPDGNHVAYEKAEGIWIQDLDRDEPRLLVERGEQPFWSPDSQQLGFFAERQLWKVALEGAEADLICDAGEILFGGTWSPDGRSIVYSTNGPGRGLFKVASRGGAPSPVDWGSDLGHPSQGAERARGLFPNFLQVEGRPLLAFAVADRPLDPDSKVAVLDLDNQDAVVIASGTTPFGAPNRHLAYGDASGRIWAVEMSFDPLGTVGEAFPLARSGSDPSFSLDGSLVYRVPSASNMRLVWHDRTGAVVASVGQAQPTIRHPDLSPDREFALATTDDDVLLHDLRRGLATNLTTSQHLEIYPVWAPWGALFRRDGKIFTRSLEKGGETGLLHDREGRQSPYHVGPAGRRLLFGDAPSGEPWNIWTVERNESGELSDASRLVRSESNTVNAQISPNGEFVAYASSGRRGRNDWHVVVQPLSPGSRHVRVSDGEGTQPRWNPLSDELFYVEDDTLVTVTLDLSAEIIRVDGHQRLFSSSWIASNVARPTYAVSGDGNQFLIAVPDPESEPSEPKIRLVENWYEEFRDRE